MARYKTVIVNHNGTITETPEFPAAILRKGTLADKDNFWGDIVDPVFDDKIVKNLYGRIMTLVEATTEPSRLKSVKDVFSKEIKSWSEQVYEDAAETCQYASSQIEL